MIGKTCKLCKTDPSIQTQFRLSQYKKIQLLWFLSEWQLRLVGKFIPNLRIHCWDSDLVAVWRAAVFVKFLLELPVSKFGREAFVNKLCEFGSYASVVFFFSATNFLDSETWFLLNKCCQSVSLFNFKGKKQHNKHEQDSIPEWSVRRLPSYKPLGHRGFAEGVWFDLSIAKTLTLKKS